VQALSRPRPRLPLTLLLLLLLLLLPLAPLQIYWEKAETRRQQCLARTPRDDHWQLLDGAPSCRSCRACDVGTSLVMLRLRHHQLTRVIVAVVLLNVLVIVVPLDVAVVVVVGVMVVHRPRL